MKEGSLVDSSGSNGLLWAGEEGPHEADGVFIGAESMPRCSNSRAPLEQVFGTGLAHVAEGAGIGWVLGLGDMERSGSVGQVGSKVMDVVVVVEGAEPVQASPAVSIQHELRGALRAPGVGSGVI